MRCEAGCKSSITCYDPLSSHSQGPTTTSPICTGATSPGQNTNIVRYHPQHATLHGCLMRCSCKYMIKLSGIRLSTSTGVLSCGNLLNRRSTLMEIFWKSVCGGEGRPH